MKSLWNDKDAAAYADDLGLRVYTSRLLGQDKSLVLHGGGNTSVKITEKNIFGEEERLLYVKGSGWDLETIDRAGFAPVKLDHLVKLSKLETLSDPDMVNELKTHVSVASAPTPSVETILHATLPYKFVDHTHADAIVTVTNTARGPEFIKEIFGSDVVVVPYVMPGFDLARVCAQEFENQINGSTIGMVLLNHGIFSFSDDARESYERMIALVTRAEEFLQKKHAWKLSQTETRLEDVPLRQELVQLRAEVSRVAKVPMILCTQRDSETLSFANRTDIEKISQQGPATPDHVIRTKQFPMLGRDTDDFAKSYEKYFNTFVPGSKNDVTMLNPAPRIILDAKLGLITTGRSVKEALINNEIYQHTMEIIQRAELLDGYQALPSKDIFEVEYWDLEQAKLRQGGTPPVYTGEVAMVTGAASGIGKSCVDSFLSRGAAVVGLDINESIETLHQNPNFLGITCDVADGDALQHALEQCVRQYGGLDMLVLNAGIFPQSMTIDEMDFSKWNNVLEINLTAGLKLLQLSHPLLKLAPAGARIVVVGSKNVAAPGPGAGAYSASKAALNQLMRIAALEWGADNIRINTLHPDAVFDTGIWTDKVITARAKNYGMTVEQYKKRNVMKVEITSHDVAELAAEMCGPLFAKTTAAQVPIDGGDVRVI